MIADLKKENFDLKLRLYHLEDLMTKDLDIYQLNDEVGAHTIGLVLKSSQFTIFKKEL